jgi:hypothetical protein
MRTVSTNTLTTTPAFGAGPVVSSWSRVSVNPAL